MKTYLVLAFLLVAIQCKYPILIYGTDLGRGDLFMTEQQLVERLTQQSAKKILVFNVQTYLEESDSFINQLKVKTEQLKTFKSLFYKSFVSPYIQYNHYNLTHNLMEKNLDVQTTQVNFINLNNVEQTLANLSTKKQLKDAILIITFSQINANVKILQEIIAAETGSQTTTDTSANTDSTTTTDTNTNTTDTAQADASSNLVNNMTSNQLAGLLVFLPLLLTVWIAVSCLMAIDTPERFVKTSFHYGKEN